MEAICSSETSAQFLGTTRRYIPDRQNSSKPPPWEPLRSYTVHYRVYISTPWRRVTVTILVRLLGAYNCVKFLSSWFSFSSFSLPLQEIAEIRASKYAMAALFQGSYRVAVLSFQPFTYSVVAFYARMRLWRIRVILDKFSRSPETHTWFLPNCLGLALFQISRIKWDFINIVACCL
jgi:hypothetical protein